MIANTVKVILFEPLPPYSQRCLDTGDEGLAPGQPYVFADAG
jgi:hypothetical protein